MSLFPQSGPSPPLPLFRTLLVKGDYHSSAPIHLALSRIAGSNDSEVIIVTPSRQAIVQALHTYNDDWLAINSGCGDVSALSARIKLYYPPSPAHLCLLLSMFRVSDPTDVESGAWINPATTIVASPSLLILHELSTYFLSAESGNPDSSQWTVSSYMEIITHALSSLTFLSITVGSRSTPSFALFDSQLDQIKLPILKQPEYQNPEDPPPRFVSLAPLVQRYFEWMVVTDPERDIVDGDRRRRGMKVHRTNIYPEVAEAWQWWEIPGPVRRPSERRGRLFVWNN